LKRRKKHDVAATGVPREAIDAALASCTVLGLLREGFIPRNGKR